MRKNNNDNTTLTPVVFQIICHDFIDDLIPHITSQQLEAT